MATAREASLQVQFAPRSICFGCGPANTEGLRLESRRDTARAGASADTSLVASWTPGAHHEAFPGVLNGGIIGTLLDCHSNWTAAIYLMGRRGADRPPVCVTADYAVKLLRPTPSGTTLTLRSHVMEATADRATIEATIEVDGDVTAHCRGRFVAVGPGHPAYGSWEH